MKADVAIPEYFEKNCLGEAHAARGDSPVERQIPRIPSPHKTPTIPTPHTRDKKAIEERDPMELLACNIPIPSSRKKSIKARQKLSVPLAVLLRNPSRA